jgi:hypothetical protein
MGRELSVGNCEKCHDQFGYYLIHSGFNDSVYAYCDLCGKTAILDLRDKRMPTLQNCPPHQEICSAIESYLCPCDCGGHFKQGAAPRCPRCGEALSAEFAASYIESNAPGTAKGWRWQRSWKTLYCIVIENKLVQNNFR